MKYILVFILFISILNCGKESNAKEAKTEFETFPHQYIGNIDRARFNEPSGICWHLSRKTLFLVGDEGDIAEIKTDGSLIKQKRILNADFEGITSNPETGLLYIVIEGEEKILEVDPVTFHILGTYLIPRKIENKTLLSEAGDGIEAITFVSDTEDPEGGFFYIANQSFVLNDEDDLSAVFKLELPIKSKKKTGRLLEYFEPGEIDLSGLFYDNKREKLYLLSDSKNLIFIYEKANKRISKYYFPGRDQEGITMDDQGYMYIAQDSGGIIKIKVLTEKISL